MRHSWRAVSVSLIAVMWTTGAFFHFSVPALAQSTQYAELAQVDSIDGLSYVLSGLGTSRLMKLTLRNSTTRLWIVHVEVGTKLEPKNGDIQEMAVTTDIRVTVHPHDETSVELDVACLDIADDAPPSGYREWRVRNPVLLRQFITCANTAVDAYKDRYPQDAARFEAARLNIVQFALWQARGASRPEMIDFFVKYQRFSREAAAKQVDAWQELLAPIGDVCPSLRDI